MSDQREPWTCPLCERNFRIPAGHKLSACPDCEKKPTLKRTKAPVAPPPAQVHRIPVYTTDKVADFAAVEYLPVVASRRVYGINLLTESWNEGYDWIGGRVPGYERVLNDIERELLYDLSMAAENIGANAVVSCQMQFGEFTGKGVFMIWGAARGTPIRFSERRES